MCRIVLGGEPGCGKSTLSASLFHYFQSMGVSCGLHEIDVYSDTIPCILGHKPWSRRRKKKRAWFNPTIKRVIEAFQTDENKVVIGDLPGRLTNPFLPKMVAPADSAIIVTKSGGVGLEQWRKFFRNHHIPILAVIMSEIDGQMDLFNPITTNNVIRVRGLDRQVVINEDITAVASHIITPKRKVLQVV